MNASTSTRSRSRASARRGAHRQGNNASVGKDSHLVILRQDVHLEIFGGPPATSHQCAVRVAIETIQGDSTLAVTLVREGKIVVYWPHGEQADVLQIFRLHRFIAGMRSIKHEYLEHLLTYVREAELPAGNAHKRFRKHSRQAFSAAMAHVPSPNDVLQALLHCREFGIHADTESLSALAAEGRFDVTSQLRAEGVIPGGQYRARSAKIDGISAGMRSQIDATCALFRITFDNVAGIVRDCVGYGIDPRTICMQIAVQCLNCSSPILLMTGFGPTLALVPQGDLVDRAKPFVAQALGLDQREMQAVERDFLGLQWQLRRGGLQKVTNV